MKRLTHTILLVLCLSSVGILLFCGRSQQSNSLTITTSSLPNGMVGAQYTQNLQASGGAGPFNWSLGSGAMPHNLTLNASTSNTATISGTPDTAAQAVAFTIRVTDSSDNSASHPYSVSIMPQLDDLSLSPPSLTFPAQAIGTSNVQTETLANIGSTVLNISGITAVGDNTADFIESTTCGSTLASGASCAVNVSFIPTQAGPRSASIAITDDTGGSPQSVALEGVGLASGPNATLSAQNMNFNSQTSAIEYVILTNYGTAALNVFGITSTTNFGESNTCVPSVASGANCTIDVTFAPSTTGGFSGTLSITDDAPGGEQTISLAGTGAIGKTTLSGRCVGGLVDVGGCEGGNAQDLNECAIGQPAITPMTETYGCLGGSVLVDLSRSCQAKDIVGATVKGHCEAQ